ncbi:MAG: hypothetical protein ACI4RP_04265 [Acutalibacteraceae bacterium]
MRYRCVSTVKKSDRANAPHPSATPPPSPRWKANPRYEYISKETLIKSFVHIAPSDFSSGWTNKPQ